MYKEPDYIGLPKGDNNYNGNKNDRDSKGLHWAYAFLLIIIIRIAYQAIFNWLFSSPTVLEFLINIGLSPIAVFFLTVIMTAGFYIAITAIWVSLTQRRYACSRAWRVWTYVAIVLSCLMANADYTANGEVIGRTNVLISFAIIVVAHIICVCRVQRAKSKFSGEPKNILKRI